MLHEFLTHHRDAIIERARTMVAARRVPVATPAELNDGVPLFLSQIVDLLLDERRLPPLAPVQTTGSRANEALGATADQRGDDMMRAGLTVAQVIEGYGDVCQAITEEAAVARVSISPQEYQPLNLSLDVATARAVTAFSRERDRATDREGTERLGRLAHELRNHLSTALLAWDALKRGAVGVEGSTGAMLGRSLNGLRDVVDRSLTEVRLAATLYHPEQVRLAPFMEEIEIGAALAAKARGLALHVTPVGSGLAVHADRQLLGSAVGNLVQNAIKFTRPGGRVSLAARQEGDRILIEVEDECGGLPPGKAEEIFRPFASAGADRTGLGLGLKISRDAVRANGGEITVRNLPGKGCVFTVALPATARAPARSAG